MHDAVFASPTTGGVCFIGTYGWFLSFKVPIYGSVQKILSCRGFGSRGICGSLFSPRRLGGVFQRKCSNISADGSPRGIVFMSGPICLCKWTGLHKYICMGYLVFLSVCVVYLLCEEMLSSAVVQNCFMSFQMPLNVSYGFWDIPMCSGGQRCQT